MKKNIFLLCAALLVPLVFAENAAVVSIVPQDSHGIEVSLSFYDKTLYYPGLRRENPVSLKVSLRNSSSETRRFKLADDRSFSLDFLATDARNQPLECSPSLLEKRTLNSTVYFREIAMEPGEEYSFVENLKDYVDFASPAVYYVDAYFYPELVSNETSVAMNARAAGKEAAACPLRSNRIVCEIKPHPGAATLSSASHSDVFNPLVKPEAISPDKVVERTIVARQRSLWDQFFLYFDLEEMMISDPVLNRRYRNESAAERARMLDAYKLEIRQERINRDIVSLPSSFDIERTTYTKTEGVVSVIEYFDYERFREKKRYTYKLRLRDGIWRICSYSVDNLGTE